MPTERTVRPEASLVEVVDGDTYYLLVNWFADREAPWTGASVVKVRLRDYGARERYDTAAKDPKGLDRVNGHDAAALAATVLSTAKQILVEFTGLDDRGRSVCWAWVDGVSLGQTLEALHAVAKTSTVGLA